MAKKTVTMNIVITENQQKKLKMFAILKGKTISKVISDYINKLKVEVSNDDFKEPEETAEAEEGKS